VLAPKHVGDCVALLKLKGILLSFGGFGSFGGFDTPKLRKLRKPEYRAVMLFSIMVIDAFASIQVTWEHGRAVFPLYPSIGYSATDIRVG
jgi:hypothetical protein